MMRSWDKWIGEALQKLQDRNLYGSQRRIHFHSEVTQEAQELIEDEFEVFEEMQPRDRASVEIQITEPTFQKWIHDIPSIGDEEGNEKFKKLLNFSGNDYLGLASHPTVKKAAAKAVLEHGMGPRGSAVSCGYTDYHRRLELSLADLKGKEDCILCPTGYAANMALMVVLGSIGSLLAAGKTPLPEEKIAIFSDSLNHASIIDGITLAGRQKSIQTFIYRHNDMNHLSALLLNCTMKKKIVIVDTLFSMDGDLAPMTELVKLRKQHGFQFIADDAHGSMIFGKTGGGVAEEFDCEKDVDIYLGTLSKAIGCHGGFIACSKRLKQLIQSRGRAFIFSTAALVPIVAAAHAAVVVGRKELWRRRAVWERVEDFRALTGIPIESPIVSLIVGSEEKAHQASASMLKSGFHVTAIIPPVVAPNSCRLRVTLNATHTREDVERITVALSRCINFRTVGIHGSNASPNSRL